MLFLQTWAQGTFKISSLRPSSYFYIQDKNQVLRSLKTQAQARISIFQKFQTRILSVNQAQASKMRIMDSNIEQKKPKYFESY